MQHSSKFDVIIVGGGHAGCEAAAASARSGAKTLLLTHKISTIGAMSCNPAIGGLGKGHLVREIDAMDGIMGLAIDRAGIQFRMLNQSKGPAVRGPRAQADRKLYAEAVQNLLFELANLTIIEGAAASLIVSANRTIEGIVTEAGTEFFTPSLVITSGTFLGGVIHIGDEQISAGRHGEPPSLQLAATLRNAGLPVGRLKTGTPPRLDGKTIDWQQLERQDGDRIPQPFSFMNEQITTRQIACFITHTNMDSHNIIRENLSKSALHCGNISGVGPRYCPSIEDKISRFAEKTSHQIFLEPEGLDDDTVYPNGISTSLPQSVQESLVHSIKGLENTKILRYGYAIEYDYFDPRGLKPSLESKFIAGLFLAGQINGTTGYEEAAGQGLIAGINAARLAGNEPPYIPKRTESYIGVMIDDLIHQGAPEPYRLFTARAEFRLKLRADNADLRLTPDAIALNIISSKRAAQFTQYQSHYEKAKATLQSLSHTPNYLSQFGINLRMDGIRRTAFDLLRHETVSHLLIAKIWSDSAEEISAIPPRVFQQLSHESHYSVYFDRQESDIASFKQDESLELPSSLDLNRVGSLSNELREKLHLIKPANIGAASRIPGMTPAALTALLRFVRKGQAA